jgi:uncharacterized membrane protein
MLNVTFRIKEIMSLGWESFKKNALLLIVLLGGSFLLNLVINAVSGVLSVPTVIPSILTTVLGMYFTLSALRASYAAANGQSPSWEVLKNEWRPYVKFFVIFIFLSIIFFISAILLLLPLLFTFSLFLCVPFIFVENPKIGIIEIFQKSWNISIKHIWFIILYVILWLVIIIFTAIITLGLAMLVTAPLFYVTSAHVYKKLNEAYIETQEVSAADSEITVTK